MNPFWCHVLCLAMLTACISVAAEAPVDTLATKDQERIAVTQLTNGTVVFAWEDESTGKSEVWFRRYDSNLVALAGPLPAQSFGTTNQMEPAIAPCGSGFVIVWATPGFDGDDYGIVFRRFEANGNPIDPSRVRVNTTTNGAQLRPEVAPLSDGGFVVVWSDQSGAYQAGSEQDVRYRRFAANGLPVDANDLVANAWGISPRITGNQGSPRVAMRPNGGFVITYEDRATDQVLAVRFDGSGNPLQVPSAPSGTYQQVVNISPLSGDAAPAIAAFADGSYVITYNAELTGSGRRVITRVFQSAGVGLDELVLGSFTNRTQDARLAALPNGQFIATMQAHNVGPDIGTNDWASVLVQRVRTNNSFVTPSFIANSYHANDQERPTVAALRDGSYVLAWQSFGQDGDRWGVYAQRFTAAGEPSGGRLVIARSGAEPRRITVRLTNGTPYVPYRLQASETLRVWKTLLSTSSPSGSFEYTESNDPSNPVRLFRALTP
jgi:hypothetical protein